MRREPGLTVEILVEALPYIREFHGTTLVVKFGGNAMVDDELLQTFADDIVLLHSVGIQTVVVHGGGPQIGDVMERFGKEPRFQDGLRVTDAETLEIAGMVLVGKVTRQIVSAINVHGPLAVMVGPEGGFTVKERDAALGAGWAPVRLARATLRFDTAGIVALALAAAARAGDRTEEGR